MPVFNLHESQYMKLIKYKLWVKDPRCIYCGIETILPEECNEKGKPAPPHMATIDHKYSRLNPLRDVVKQEYLLCCNLCNNYRGQVEQGKLSLEELQRRSRKGFERKKIHKSVYVKSSYNPKTGKGKLLENGNEVPLKHVPFTPVQTISIKTPIIVVKQWITKLFRPNLPFQK